MRPRLRSTLAGIGVVVLLGVLPGTDRAVAQPKPIKIGEINSYSGVATVYTFPYKEGLAMATKEINDAGGVLGRPLEFILRDDKLKPDEAVKAARELVLQEKVDFLAGCISSCVGLAISAYAKDAKILYFATHCQTSRLTWDDGHRYVAHTTNNVNQYVRAARQEGVDLAVQEVGAHLARLRVRPQHVGGVLDLPQAAQAGRRSSSSRTGPSSARATTAPTSPRCSSPAPRRSSARSGAPRRSRS